MVLLASFFFDETKALPQFIEGVMYRCLSYSNHYGNQSAYPELLLDGAASHLHPLSQTLAAHHSYTVAVVTCLGYPSPLSHRFSPSNRFSIYTAHSRVPSHPHRLRVTLVSHPQPPQLLRNTRTTVRAQPTPSHKVCVTLVSPT